MILSLIISLDGCNSEIYIFIFVNSDTWPVYMLICSNLVQPVKIIDPHLVLTFFDGYKRVYLHATTELENKSAWVAKCNMNIQVIVQLEGSFCLVEHLQTQHVSIPTGKSIQYTFPEVCCYS